MAGMGNRLNMLTVLDSFRPSISKYTLINVSCYSPKTIYKVFTCEDPMHLSEEKMLLRPKSLDLHSGIGGIFANGILQIIR